MGKIGVFGSSGFVGKSLMQNMKDVFPISIREVGWESKLRDLNVVINLIGKAHDHKGTTTEEEYYDVNVELTKEMFRQFVKSNVLVFLHISSIAAVEEFGSDEGLSENALCNPSSNYGKSKRAAEEWLLNQPLPEGKRLIIIRPPMIHGPGDKGNLSLLFKFVKKGIPYPLMSFQNKRSFLYIGNLFFYIERIIENFEKMESGIYHVADHQSLSTNEVVRIIYDVVGRKGMEIEVPKWFVKSLARVGDVIPIPFNSKRLRKLTSNLIVSSKSIDEVLGIDQLPFSGEEGIRKTIQSLNDC